MGIDLGMLLLGVALAALGGEVLVRGAVGFAQWARVAPGIIGATVTAFATSSPELAVAVTASVAGAPEIALGDALGSNVVNIALILGLSLALSGTPSRHFGGRREIPVALLAPALTGALMLDGTLSRLDGVLLLSVFLAWAVAVTLEARRQRSAAAAILGAPTGLRSALLMGGGVGLLVAGGRLIVGGGTGLAAGAGIDAFLVGATVVALGTSTPELATTLIARAHKHDEVALGTVLGSNIFNGLLIIAVAALIRPIEVQWQELALTLAFGFLAVGLTIPLRDGLLGRRRGLILLALYFAYVGALVQLRVP